MPLPTDPAAFLDSTPLVPIEIDAPGAGVRYVGPQACALLGYPTDVWYAEGFWSAKVLPDDQANAIDARRNSFEARGRHEIDYRMEHEDGRVVWVAELLQYAESEGRPLLRGFLWDVTGRKRQEVALWRSEERVRALLRRAPDAMVLTDAEGAVVNMNDQAEALFDYSLSDIVGSSIVHLLPEPLRPRLAELREAFERDPQRRSLVEGQPFAVQRSDGSEIPVEVSLSRVSDADEEGRILWSARDLTARRRLESLRRSEGQRATDSALEPMSCSVDRSGRLVYADDAFTQWVESPAEELRGRLVGDMLGAQLMKQLEGEVHAALEGRAGYRRCELGAPGRRIVADVAVAPRHDAGGALVGYTILMLPG